MNRRRHPLYEPYVSFKGFEEAEKLFNDCANEGFFAPLQSYLDCDFCPVKDECLKFWNDYVSVEPNLQEREEYLDTVKRAIEILKRGKRGGHEEVSIF